MINFTFAAITTIIVYFGLLFVKRSISTRLVSHKEYKLINALIRKTKWFFTASIALFFGSFFLTDDLAQITSRVVLIAVMIQIGIWGNQLITYFISNYKVRDNEDGLNRTTMNLLQITAKTIFWIVIVLFLLDNLKFDIKTLIAGLGIGGIAVALAMQNILGDALASMSIIADKPFLVGDLIQVDTFKGYVEKIGIKTTRIRSMSGEQIIFSNTELLKSRLRNFRMMTERRVVFQLRLPHRTAMKTILQVKEEVREIIESISLARFDRIHFVECATTTLDFEVVYYVLSPETTDFKSTQEKINLKLLTNYHNSKIKLVQ